MLNQPRWRLTQTFLLGLVLCLGTGCLVTQPPGEGKYLRMQEPTTKAVYHLYLPVDYVRRNGRQSHSQMKRWPLVMTFHGMNPYDNATAQEREWEKEADFYGYIVCAPELATCNSFMEYPLTKEHDYLLRDKRNVVAIMNHIFATWRADPQRVLSTSWSCGGYLAHYFANRFPEKFSCIATRLSNFSPKLMFEQTVPLYRDKTPVAIFIGDGDFPACKSESEDAVAWYNARNFRVVRGKMIDNMGHRRIPQVAAAFFAEQLGIDPLRPMEAQKTLAQVRMTDYKPTAQLIAKMSPRLKLAAKDPQRRALPPLTGAGSAAFEFKTAGRKYPSDRAPSYDPKPKRDRTRAGTLGRSTRPPSAAGSTRLATAARTRSNWLAPIGQPPHNQSTSAPAGSDDGRRSQRRPAANRSARSPEETGSAVKPESAAAPLDRGRRRIRPPAASTTGRRQAGLSRNPSRRGQSAASARSRLSGQGSTTQRVNVRLSGPMVGTAPHYIAFSAELPSEALDGADCLWMDNGVWIGDESRGVKILESPGLHRITVLIVTRDNVEYRGSATVRVLEPVRSRLAAPRRVSSQR